MPLLLPDLARMHTALNWSQIAHLKRLVGSWHILSDFCFADLLLFAPVAGPEGRRFAVLDQVRPTTGQTLYRTDLVGVIYDEVDRPLVTRAFRLGEIIEGSVQALGGTERTWRFCIPVRFDDTPIAVVTRESSTTVSRRLGELERVYLEVFERLAHMIAEGEFPFHDDEQFHGEAPRVGDGVIFLDRDLRVRFASPNAVTAMHRLGIHANAEGVRLRDVGFDESAVLGAQELRTPVTEELERGDTVIVVFSLPILAHGRPDGAVVLIRDVTELRRRDRMLVSKDATIREIHHRVKNNLQTIASLLRLQGRRLNSDEAKLAIEESVRRIRAIAVVHETLSRDTSGVIAFGEVVGPLIGVIREGFLVLDQPVRFTVEGDAGDLPAEVATPLAVVINELAQNAVEHAFPDGRCQDGGEPCVAVRLARDDRGDGDGQEIVVEVRDNGVGLPDGFSVESSLGLGLSIVHSLVTTELRGSIQIKDEGGTWVHVRVPVEPAAAEPAP